MTLIIETAPEAEVISLDEMKAHIRQDSDVGTAEDEVIESLISAATKKLDGRDGLLGRCLVTQTWALRLDRFSGDICLPLPPCQSVDSITYIDVAGATQTLAPENYQVAGIGSPDGARVLPAYGGSWPSTRNVPEAIIVTFTAGYGDEGTDVPEQIRTAIKLHAAFLYANRESVVVGNYSAVELPQSAQDLISDFRAWSF